MEALKKIYFLIVAFFKSPIQAAPKAEKRKRRKRKKLIWGSFKNLKKHVDNVFKELGKKDYFGRDGYSFNVSRGTVKTLRALGPYMVTYNIVGDKISVYDPSLHRAFPTILFLGYPEKVNNENGILNPRFMFAERINKKQVGCDLERTRKDELVYSIGGAYYDKNPPKFARKYKRRLAWAHSFYAINQKTGRSRALAWRKYTKTEFYTRIEWIKPFEEDWPDHILSTLLNMWAMRDFSWQVSAKNGEHKATFCIEDNEAKDYFKDREIDDGGKRKRIFHWVKSHYRTTSKGIVPVKTHSRGNRFFTWGDYEIKIRIPGKHVYMLTDFDLEGEVSDSKRKPKGMLDLIDVVKELDKDIA